MQHLIVGTTRVYAIIGWPVAHSRSPQMHNAAFSALGMDSVYVPFAVSPDGLAEAVRGMRALGVAGWNVTVPHKTAIMPFLDEVTPEALRAGAVNTVRNLEGRLIGHNTDGSGLLAALERDLDCRVPGSRVVVLGAGGAARGAVTALVAAGVGRIAVINRTLASAQQLVGQVHACLPEAELEATDYAGLAHLLPQVDLLVNATSLGLKGEKIDGLDLALLPAAAKVYDMVYGAVATPLVQQAMQLGLAVSDGLGMLVAQGERAFEYWTGMAPPSGLMAIAAARGTSPS